MKRATTYRSWLVQQDISNYTRFAEGLRGRGKEGVSVLSSMLSRFFEECETKIIKAGGFIFKFAGDAYFALLPPTPHDEVRKFCHYLIDSKVLKSHGLTSRVAAVFGEVTLLPLKLTLQTDFFPMGEPVRVLAALEDETPAGYVATRTLSPILSQPPLRFEPVKPNFTSVRGFPMSFRPQVVSFLNVRTTDPELILSLVSHICTTMPYAALAKAIPTPDGVNFAMFFGFPESSGKERETALLASTELKEHLSSLNLNFGIGVNCDFVFSGILKGKIFKELTFLGDGVNVAARLASEAHNEILLGEKVISSHSGVAVERTGELALKGKLETVAVYRLIGKEKGGETPFVGREEELELILKSLHAGTHVLVEGEAGMGKRLS